MHEADRLAHSLDGGVPSGAPNASEQKPGELGRQLAIDLPALDYPSGVVFLAYA
jgi:hypothetical protein